MATATERRQWLLDNGEEVSMRGRIPQHLNDMYDRAHPGSLDDDPPVITDPDDGGGIGDDDFDTPELAAVVPETRPAKPRRSRERTRKGGGILGSLLSGKTGSGKPKPGKKTPRISLDKFLSRVYTRGGQMVSAFAPATGRCLQAQSAMAGIILEDVARDTAVDRFLQPVARAEDKLDKVFALAAPPALVFALEVTQPEDMMRRAMLTGLLRESLLISMDITSAYAEQIQAMAQRTAENEAAVDQLLAFIFPPPAPAEQPDMEMAAA